MATGFNIEGLLNPDFYDHPVVRVELVETHISWVFLAGDFAYKVKKPVNFGFLDFSTLQKRQHFCEEELRLNRRIAPQLYLAVVAFGGDPENPTLNATPVLDYAVKMKRFPQDAQLDRMLAAGQLTADHMDQFAVYIAAIHQRIAAAEAKMPYGSPQAVIEPVLQNFRQIRSLLSDQSMLKQLDQLEDWSRALYVRLMDLLTQRKATGLVRECHGDVHLGNMAWFNDEPLLFDCIEFNANLHWIDTMNDIAFLIMDLDDRGERVLAWRFLNGYLRKTGDYTGLPLLAFYKVYRALVRAKVICLRLSQSGLSREERDLDRKLLSSYLALAGSYTADQQPLLIITHGFSGSGKTSFVTQLAPLCGAVSIHSDLERKRLHQLAAEENSHSPVAGGIYSVSAGLETYARLYALAEVQLRAGISVIVDATFIKKAARDQFIQLAKSHLVPLLILDFPLAEHQLEKRLEARANQGGSVSEATAEVLAYQLAHEDPLSGVELEKLITVYPQSEPEQIAAPIINPNSCGLQ